MKTSVKRSQAAPIMNTTLVHMLMNQLQMNIGSKLTAKKCNHDERLNYNKGFVNYANEYQCCMYGN
jgi:hypothetical protein